jgi:hypothetical protein
VATSIGRPRLELGGDGVTSTVAAADSPSTPLVNSAHEPDPYE